MPKRKTEELDVLKLSGIQKKVQQKSVAITPSISIVRENLKITRQPIQSLLPENFPEVYKIVKREFIQNGIDKIAKDLKIPNYVSI